METDPIMPIERRAQAQRPNQNYSTSNGIGHIARKPNEPPELLSYADSLKEVPWQTDNDHILSGYRRQLPTIKSCVHSAFACELGVTAL